MYDALSRTMYYPVNIETHKCSRLKSLHLYLDYDAK